MYASSHLGANNANVVMATQEYSISGYNTTTKSFVNQSLMVNTLVSTTVPSLPTIYIVTKGKKQYEPSRYVRQVACASSRMPLKKQKKDEQLSNHLGNVLATISDRRIPRDDNGDLFVDYFNPDIYSTNDYYAFGSPLPGRQGIQKCSMVNVSTNVTNYAAQENFSSGSTGGFVAGTGNRNVSNPTGNALHLEAFWTTRPLANKTVAVTAGTTYTLNTDIVGFSSVAGYSHTVRIRVIGGGLSTIIANYTSTGAITPITFTPTATGNITIEISSVITGSGTYSINPYIDIDNFSVTYITTTTSSVLACTPLEGYRYNFNGKETDSETGLQDYGFRIYNPWLGKFLSVDPLTSKYPWLTPYQFASNTPIWAIDVDGLEASVNSDPANQSATPTREEYNKYCSNWKNMGLAYCLNGFNHTTQIMVNDNTYCNNPVMQSAAISAKIATKNNSIGDGKISFTPQSNGNTKIVDNATGASNEIKRGEYFYRYYWQRDASKVSWNNLFYEFENGTGPSKSLFTDFSGNAGGVFTTLRNPLSNYSSKARSSLLSTTNTRGAVSFDYSELNPITAGTDGWEQFLGRASLSWYKLGDNNVLFMINDSKSMTSFAYRMSPNWNRSKYFKEFGNTYQTYIWTESITEIKAKNATKLSFDSAFRKQLEGVYTGGLGF